MDIEQRLTEVKHTQNEIRDYLRLIRHCLVGLCETLPQISKSKKFRDELTILHNHLIHTDMPRKR